MKITRYIAFVIIFLTYSLLFGKVCASNITTDPVLQQALERQNWEIGGKYFGFGAVRGAVDPASRTGEVSIATTSSVRIGSFMLEGASISGTYGFVAPFSNHPYTEHSPFDATNSSSDAYKSDPKTDGTQTSFFLQWTGMQVHPADAYDPPQGGGFPAPTGARDEYKFTINGIATGTYLVSGAQLQAIDRPGFWARTENYGNATVEHLVAGWGTETNGATFLIYGDGWRERLGGAADLINGASEIIFSGLSGLIQGYAGPELSAGFTSASDYYVKNVFNLPVNPLDQQSDIAAQITSQYATIQSFQGVGDWISENELGIKVAGAAANLVFAGWTTAKSVAVTEDFFAGTTYSTKVLGQMKGGVGELHSFPESVKAFQDAGTITKILGGDGVTREMLVIPGEYGGKAGQFEFIKGSDGEINHRFFRPDQ